MACPNVNLESWKELEASVGTERAYYLWDKYDGKVPQEEYSQDVSIDLIPQIQELNNFVLFEDRDNLCAGGICNLTAAKSTEMLEKAGLNPFPNPGNYGGDSLPVTVKSPLGDFPITHYVAASAINDSIYIYDMPQNEFISDEDFGMGNVSLKTAFKPRLIPLTIDSIKANYNLNSQDAAKFIREVLNRRAVNLVNPAFRSYIQNNIKNSEEYIKSLEDQISSEGVMLDAREEYKLKQESLEELKDKKREVKLSKPLTGKEENKVINFLRNKLKLKTKEYLPTKSLSFTLGNIIKSVTGLHFDYSRENLDTALNEFKNYTESDQFLSDVWDRYSYAKSNLDNINQSLDRLFSFKRLLYGFFKLAKTEGIKNALSKYDSIQQHKIKTFLPRDILTKYASDKQAVFMLEKTYSNINVIIKSLNINFGKPLTEIMKDKMKLNAQFEKANTVLNYLKAVDFDASYIYESIANEAKRRFAYFEKQGNVSFQKEEMSASKASNETLNKVKEVIKKMGVSIETLTEYAKKNPDIDLKGINGVADLVRGVIAFASGREEALTEEMVHMATAILEQTNPKLVTEMLSKIDRFKIYKETLEAYKNNKNYQLSNGKPDIRKIKKEAVDKLIAEVIINQNDGSTEFPELMQEENQSMIRKWWNAILDLIRGMYKSSNINIFEEVAGKVMGEEGVGTVADIKNGEVFFQIAKNEKVDDYYDKIIDKDSKLKLNPETPTDKRHYTFDGKRVKETVTEKVKSGSNMPDRTGLDKQMDDEKQAWGSSGHNFLENYFSQALIDENGYPRAKPLDVKINSNLSEEMQTALKGFAVELIRSYDDRPGTRFIIERKMVNENVKGMIASTVDFKAISPDSKTGVKIDTLDWKFTSINKNVTEDIPWFKRGEWKQQMGEYTKMDYSYGAKPEQIGKARMVPFIMNYEFAIPGEPKSGLVPKSIEIGKLDVLQETKLYLLPVATDVEKTTSPQVDELIKSLDQQWEKLWKKPVIAEKREGKLLQLNQLSKAIRLLKAKMSFEPLAMVGRGFLKNANEAFKAFENLDYSKLTKDDVRNKLKDLEEFKASAEKFAGLDQIFVSLVPKEGMSEENKKILAALEDVSNSTGRMMLKINELQRQYVVQVALKEGLTTETTKDTILDAEREVDAMSKTFLEGSKLSAKIIKLGSNLIMNAKSLVSIKVSNAAKDYDPLIIALEKEAAAKGKTAFELIGDDKTLTLIKKIDKKFYEDLSEAKKKKDKQFLLDNMDVAKYDALAKEAIKNEIEEINKMDFSTDEEEDAAQRAYKIKQAKNKYDIHSETFNGYESFGFSKLFKQVMKEDKHLSKEYIQMSKSKAALDMWTYLVGLNEKAREMGYLTKQGNSFFPLMEASLIQKISQGDSFTGELKDFFKDQYTVKVNEQQVYSKTDPETNKLRKEIPRLFTRTDKENSQLSRDLTKVVSLWTRSLLEYESNKDLEYTLLTMHSVEKSKGQLLVDENNNIVYEAGAPKVDRKNIKNADILETIVDDAIYGLRENTASLGNVALSMGVSKLSGKTDEEKETTKVSIKKGLEQGNILTRSLAVGLKLLVAIPNYVGYHLHSIINSGTFYNIKDFEKNNLKTTTGLGLTTIDKGLLDLIVPLNDDITKEKMRELAKKQGYIKYLSTWTFNDVMMITNAWPEKKLQLANAQSFNENSMVVNGKIVNIRQYLRKQDREAREKGITIDQRKELENTFEKRVSDLKESSALSKIAKIENDRVVIPGVSDEELAKYRTKVIEFSRTLNGQMSDSNKADYRRDTIFRSFMMFKNWMPKMIASRTLDIQKNIELDEWEYGRARAFVKTWAHLGLRNIFKMSAIINGTEEGLAILDEMLEAKKRDYFIKNGEELTITKEEFYDLMRRELSREAKELGLLFGLMSLVLAAKAAEPPEDATEEEKNRYKFWAKATNKIYDELAFYYNPISFEGMTSGSVIPSISLLSRGQKIITHLSKEAYGYATDDEKMMDKAHPTKYFLDVIPIASQFNREILPLIDPELAKELGIRVTVETGRR